MQGEITTRDGLLFRDGKMIDLPTADQVARQHGFLYAERFVKHLEEKQQADKKGNPCMTTEKSSVYHILNWH